MLHGFRVISLISPQRHVSGGELDSYLMTSAGMQIDLNEIKIILAVEQFIVKHGLPAMGFIRN